MSSALLLVCQLFVLIKLPDKQMTEKEKERPFGTRFVVT